MSSTFTAPIRINKFNNSTNNGVIAPSNTGAAQCSQQQFVPSVSTPIGAGVIPTFKIGEITPSPLVIPGGSSLVTFRAYQTSAPSAITGGVITASIQITDPVTGVVTTTPLGTYTITTFSQAINFTNINNATVAAIYKNIGPLDATIVFTTTAITAITGTVAATFSVIYVPRNTDGSITAYGSGYTNT
jgi:hypothetical protein